MANISLVRVDFRLIHGQVITKWRKVFNVTKCIIVNNDLSKDEFLSRVYISAAPPDMKVKIYDEDKAVRLWEKNQFKEGNVLLLFNDIGTCYRLVKRGIKIPFLQLGGLPSSSERKNINTAVSLSKAEIDMIKEIHDSYGIDVYIHVTPEKSKVGFDEIIKTFNG